MWYLTDHLGSVRGITSGTGTPLTTISYDAWGKVLSNSTPAQGDAYGFTGRPVDAITGGRDHRGRVIIGGQWLQEDPLGLAVDANPRRYVGNQPTGYTDPSGMAGMTLDAATETALANAWAADPGADTTEAADPPAQPAPPPGGGALTGSILGGTLGGSLGAGAQPLPSLFPPRPPAPPANYYWPGLTPLPAFNDDPFDLRQIEQEANLTGMTVESVKKRREAAWRAQLAAMAAAAAAAAGPVPSAGVDVPPGYVFVPNNTQGFHARPGDIYDYGEDYGPNKHPNGFWIPNDPNRGLPPGIAAIAGGSPEMTGMFTNLSIQYGIYIQRSRELQRQALLGAVEFIGTVAIPELGAGFLAGMRAESLAIQAESRITLSSAAVQTMAGRRWWWPFGRGSGFTRTQLDEIAAEIRQSLNNTVQVIIIDSRSSEAIAGLIPKSSRAGYLDTDAVANLIRRGILSDAYNGTRVIVYREGATFGELGHEWIHAIDDFLGLSANASGLQREADVVRMMLSDTWWPYMSKVERQAQLRSAIDQLPYRYSPIRDGEAGLAEYRRLIREMRRKLDDPILPP